MCLYKGHKYPKRTIFPKTVFKIVEIKPDGSLSSFFRNSPVEIGKTYTGKFKGSNGIIDTIQSNVIEDGFIHSYTDLVIARNFIYSSKSAWTVVECKVPMFTLYYEDTLGREIASRKLKYIKIVGRYDKD